MSQKVMTKFVISVVEYDKTGYYYPKYRTNQTIIAKDVDEALDKAIKRTPWRHNFGSGWTKKASIVSSEDIIVEGDNND